MLEKNSLIYSERKHMIVNNNIIRVPHKRYIETLIIGGMSSPQVQAELTRLNLDYPTDWLKTILDDLVNSNPEFFNSNPRPEPDEDWLRSRELLGMYGYRFNKPIEGSTLGCQGALKILDDMTMRRIVDVMCFMGMPEEDIELICNSKFSINYDSADFKVYFEMFANYKEWLSSDKTLYVTTMADETSKMHFKMALKQDKDYVIWKLGLTPTKSFDSMLREMFVDSFYNFKDKQRVSQEDSQRWGTLAVKISDRIDQMESDAKGKMDVFGQLKFKLEVENTTTSIKSKDDPEFKDMQLITSTQKSIPNLASLMVAPVFAENAPGAQPVKVEKAQEEDNE